MDWRRKRIGSGDIRNGGGANKMRRRRVEVMKKWIRMGIQKRPSGGNKKERKGPMVGLGKGRGPVAMRKFAEMPKCRKYLMEKQRCFIGPDLQESGLFNFNNHLVFTHDLLDEYTSAFSKLYCFLCSKASPENSVDVDDVSDSSAGIQSSGESHEEGTDTLLKWMDEIPEIFARLQTVNTAQAQLFLSHFGSLSSKGYPPSVYRNLFMQASIHIVILSAEALTAEESILQMINRLCRVWLGYQVYMMFVGTTMSEKREVYPPDMISLCFWLYERAWEVLKKLLAKEAPLADNVRAASERNDSGSHWQKTGCLYSMPQIQSRPQYPHLKYDLCSEPGGRCGDKCSKYYSQYGEQRLTGGIIICYGFHCIPRGEGRNDVFSAIVTRWPKAPKVVVYDFACALGPYCLTHTLFVVDGFHARGHIKCSRAAFLTTYANADPRLAQINLSAAECGNSALKQIRFPINLESSEGPQNAGYY
ncbi:hypothetical protein SERLA73DRAFT_159538 [Serpula lacrymans var. lacrymans S7.3]|uniref:HMG domain-containing protein n=1 Tax=Serpula lacrymans var. lacrymans (strain S7.3) TaxID=936435 RepID=F8PT89_SERL3|nr:hypothetical protein SERLA73DRAFT_159538 [Serpula lacrymans var. lacrymans S7.3]